MANKTGMTERPGQRPAGRFRFSGRFIKWATIWIFVAMGVLVIGGFILGAVSDGVEGDAGETLGNWAALVVIGGLIAPLMAAAILGGEAIRKGAGVIGFALIAGLTLVATASTDQTGAWFGAWRVAALWGGFILMALAVAGFWIAGWIARVPMWLQGPMVGSPRTYVRGRSEDEADTNLDLGPRHRDID